MKPKFFLLNFIIIMLALIIVSCSTPEGPEGPPGPQGPAGPQGVQGPPGESSSLTEDQLQALEAAGALSGIQFPALDEARRGCPACHFLVDETDGKYTLPFEAHERAEARGNQHPEVAPDGTSLAPTEEVIVTTCLLCHAPGTGEREGKGVIAPLALRDIVHPAHLYSPWFKFHYGGNCFTCHNVNGEGEFELLTEKVDVNDKGVPNPELIPIPGSIELHDAHDTESSTEASESIATLSLGGKLYDKWWSTAGLDEPAGDSLIWARQSTNTRSGTDTYRCKECHGWDYMGVDGAYSSGSHFTGFPSVLNSAGKSADELLQLLSGSVDPDHDFSILDELSIQSLVLFLKKGLVDLSPYINPETKAVEGGDSSKGEQLWQNTCVACHGSDGRTLNFGDEEEPEFVGTIAVENPWEFVHKIRFGQPGTAMPAAVDSGWSLQDVIDLLTFAQSLPAGNE